MAIQGYITLTLEAFPEGKTFVSRCRELGVTSCGDSIGDAIEAVSDAVTTYLNAIEQLGERPRIFAEKGIEISSTKPRLVRVESDERPPNSFAGKRVFPLPQAA
jgi:predicted RNase H-like HicB family nuclease